MMNALKNEPLRGERRAAAAAKRAALIDGFADQYASIEQQEERLAKAKRKLRSKLLTLTRRYGVIANDAKTMRVAHGMSFDVRATYPSETIVDQEQAKEFWASVSGARRAKFLRREVRFTVVHGAFERASLLRTEDFVQFLRAAKRRSMAPRVKVVKAKGAKR